MRNRDLAKAWVNGATKGKGSNMYIEGNVIYSYGKHFPISIAMRQEDKYLFTLAAYSSSTSRHIMHTRYAIRRTDDIIFMLNLPVKDKVIDEAFHISNINHWFNTIAELKKKLLRSRQYKDHYVEMIFRDVDFMLRYTNYFNIPDLPKSVGDIPTKKYLEEFIKYKDKFIKMETNSYSELIQKWEKGGAIDFSLVWQQVEDDPILRIRIKYYKYTGQLVEMLEGGNVESTKMNKYKKFITSVLEQGGCNVDTGFKMFGRNVIAIDKEYVTLNGNKKILVERILKIANKFEKNNS